MEKDYVYKASSVELATKNGLEELGLTEEEVEVEIISQGGIFSKAAVRLTPKANGAVEETIKEEIAEEETAVEEKKSVLTDEERDEKFRTMKELREKGKEYLQGLANLMGASVTFEGKVREDEICIYIGGEDAKMFIGYKGETLEAVQTIVSQFINKDREPHIRIVVDADFYRERRKKTLVNLAKKLAKQAYNQHREIALEPMNSYERRILHAALQNSADATTRSDGEGKDRHVVIVPKSSIMSYGNVSNDFRRKGPAKTKSFGYEKKKF